MRKGNLLLTKMYIIFSITMFCSTFTSCRKEVEDDPNYYDQDKLSFQVSESNHPTLKQGLTICIANNELYDCYFMETVKGILYIYNGRYEFSYEENNTETKIPYLSLTYATVDGDFTFSATTPTKHDFDISESSADALSYFEKNGFVDWDELIKERKPNRSNQRYLILKEKGTEYKITCKF